MLFSRPGLITKALVSAAICVATTPAYASAACQAGEAGCVLPVGGAPAPAPVADAEPVMVEEGEGLFGLGILPILGALAAAAILAFVLLDDDDDDDEDEDIPVPVSP